jgi:glutamyl-Q tRNA(Asp) synthetase
MTLRAARYCGRFAPSPTGPLHAGSLAAALASWLDARAHDGTWLVRMEDIDPPREAAGAAQDIFATLEAFGLVADETPVHQSTRGALYEAALARLQAAGLVYPCTCSRKDIEERSAALGLRSAVYPGTCRGAPVPRPGRAAAWRLRVPDETIAFDDRAQGRCEQNLAHAVGDFVLRRADGLWAYQLAVVVDDAAQGITDVVRGADLLDNTPRQIYLQRLLGLPTPVYLHVPVVLNAQGQKLSKQTHAAPLDRGDVRGELERAWHHLGFAPLGADSPAAFYRRAIALWRARWVAAPTMPPREGDRHGR